MHPQLSQNITVLFFSFDSDFMQCVLYKEQQNNTCIPHLCLHGMLEAEIAFHFMLIVLPLKNLRHTLKSLRPMCVPRHIG